jgi:hypothetical protein
MLKILAGPLGRRLAQNGFNAPGLSTRARRSVCGRVHHEIASSGHDKTDTGHHGLEAPLDKRGTGSAKEDGSKVAKHTESSMAMRSSVERRPLLRVEVSHFIEAVSAEIVGDDRVLFAPHADGIA